MAISGIGSSCNLFGTAANYMQGKTTVKEAISMTEEQSVSLSISEEGFNALRERVKEFEPEPDDFDFDKLHPVETNEIEFGYYMTMRQMTGSKGGCNDAEEFMKFIMEDYETLYNQIVEAHKYGDRQVSCKIMGEKTLTLEEDLAELDKAFERRLGDLAGFVTRTQTSSILWLEHRSSIQTIQSGIEYSDMAFSMLRLARENFLASCDGKNCEKGVAKGIISDMINKNSVFMEMTKELFSNINTHKSR